VGKWRVKRRKEKKRRMASKERRGGEVAHQQLQVPSAIPRFLIIIALANNKRAKMRAFIFVMCMFCSLLVGHLSYRQDQMRVGSLCTWSAFNLRMRQK
jgi:hypothetical protein